jgi:hypothetical protein
MPNKARKTEEVVFQQSSKHHEKFCRKMPTTKIRTGKTSRNVDVLQKISAYQEARRKTLSFLLPNACHHLISSGT